jgi:hypothetical protein
MGEKRNRGSANVQVIQLAVDLAKCFGAYVGIHFDRLSVTDLGGLAAGVPEQCLDVAKVGALFQEVRGKGMP